MLPDPSPTASSDDALLFGGRPGHSIGHKAIRAYFASYDGVIDSGTMQLVDPKIVRLASDCVLVQGYADFDFQLACGEQSRSTLRATLVAVRQNEQWRIRQHHFSATDRAVQAQPIKRAGHPGDIADAVAFLASERAGFISGEVLHVTGGRYG